MEGRRTRGKGVVPLRFERGLREPKTLVLTITPWNKLFAETFLFCGAKVGSFFESKKYLPEKTCEACSSSVKISLAQTLCFLCSTKKLGCSRLDKPFERVRCALAYLLSNPQKITCIIFENLFGPYFRPHQSHRYAYAPSSGENLTSKMSFKSDATYNFHIT